MSAKVQAASGSESPSKWSRLSMGQVGRWVGGGTPSKANDRFWTSGSIPWVSPKDMKSDRIADAQDHITHEAVARSATNLVEAGSVLIVVRSGILQHTLPVAVTESQVALNQDLKAVTPHEAIRPEYLALALKAFERDILHTCTKTGTTVQSLEMPAFLRFEIPVAPREEQGAIVAEVEKQFTRLDAGVAALRRVQANLKRYRAAVLKAACEGRLVPTEAELARKEGRTFETGADLLGRILKERRESWQGRAKYQEPAAAEAGRLPSLPEGWTLARAEQLCAFITKGTTPSAQKLGAGADDVPFIRVNNLTFTGALNLSYRPVFVDRRIHEDDLARSRVRPGDILINIVGPPLGQVSVVPFSIPEANINQAIARFRVVVPECRPLLTLQLMADAVIGWATKRAKTTAGQSNLTLELCRDLPVPLPPLAEQTRIVAEVERRLSVVEKLEATVSANLQRATRLRHAVLHRAFAGEPSRDGRAFSNG